MEPVSPFEWDSLSLMIAAFFKALFSGFGLQGGPPPPPSLPTVVLVYQVQDAQFREATREVLSQRIQASGLRADLTVEGETQILVSAYGAPEQYAFLTQKGEIQLRHGGAILMGHSDFLEVSITPSATGPAFLFVTTAQGARRLEGVTRRLKGQKLELYVDDKLCSEPVVQTVISDGKMLLTGPAEGLPQMVGVLAGTLPTKLELVEIRNQQTPPSGMPP